MNALAQLIVVVAIPAVAVGCATTAIETDSETTVPVVSEISPSPKASRCDVERIGGNVIVHVVIDSRAENIRSRRLLEGTAMIRTKIRLRQEFPRLPKNFSLPSRRVKNTFDDDTGLYYYTTSFKMKDIDKRIEAGPSL